MRGARDDMRDDETSAVMLLMTLILGGKGANDKMFTDRASMLEKLSASLGGPCQRDVRLVSNMRHKCCRMWRRTGAWSLPWALAMGRYLVWWRLLMGASAGAFWPVFVDDRGTGLTTYVANSDCICRPETPNTCPTIEWFRP